MKRNNMSESSQKKIVTRFAPSPTGMMHVGGVRTALYAWLLARKHAGQFILRIEDTDKEREVAGSIDHIIESLTWLGITWDQGPVCGGVHAPYIQSERLAIYRTYAQTLITKGYAYPDPYTEEEIEQFRKKAEEENKPFLFREYRPESFSEWDGTKPLRFKVPELKRYTWNDLVWGELSAGEEALDDFILIKSDGYPTYNFAHIVDDIEMEVTHVMRGQEFISSTPKFLSVYEALGVEPPFFATLPPIMAPDGKKKLGKRDGAKDILEYRNEGYLPETMINFLAFLGWNPGDDRDVLSREELIEAFSVEKIQRSGAQLNEQKLLWLNKEHLKRLPESTRNAMLVERLQSNPLIHASGKVNDTQFISKILPILFDRISTWGDVDVAVREGEFDYFFNQPLFDMAMLSWKGESPTEEIKKHLSYVEKMLSEASVDKFTDVESIKSLIFDYATEVGRGQVLWPLRVALSGREKSPDPFTLMYILGKDESVIRIQNALKKLQ